jgi:hypothetical protein
MQFNVVQNSRAFIRKPKRDAVPEITAFRVKLDPVP